MVKDELIGKEFKVLNDGFVALVDVMGDDNAIENAARISYGDGTRKVSETRGLIRYLMRNRHTTPFEMAELKFRVRVPMDCWRQWIRHRTANVNEYSTRYSGAIDSNQKTASNEWRTQAKTNKQGSGAYIENLQTAEFLTDSETELHKYVRSIYEDRLRLGVAKEQARKDLPLSTYTEAFWKIDLHNLFHFLSLRMHEHAQYEIRQYANIIGNEIVYKLFPIAWEAFVDYRLQGMFLSRLDIDIISNNKPTSCIENKREREECQAKLAKLGLMKLTI